MLTCENIMILNGVNLDIDKIELDENGLYITDKTHKYSYYVHIYNWDEIHDIPVGDKKDIDFNEYTFAVNNVSVLILPTTCYVERLAVDLIRLYFKFDDFSNACVMNKSNKLDIELKSLEISVIDNLISNN